MIGNVAYPIDGPTYRGLITKRMRSGIDHHVSHHANVVHTAVDLEGVVVKIRHVVVVEIDRDRPSVPELFGRIVRPVDSVRAVRIPVRFNVDSIVEIVDIVVRNHVTRSVKPDSSVGRQLGWEFLTVDSIELRPEVSNPPEEVFRIVPAHEIAI